LNRAFFHATQERFSVAFEIWIVMAELRMHVLVKSLASVARGGELKE
jgi:hypothetical protein